MKPPEPIPINRKRYRGVRSRVHTVGAVLCVPFFGIGGLGFYLEGARGVPHASMMCGILAVLICGFTGMFWQRSIMSRLPCPQCGCVPLRPVEDERKMQMLICDSPYPATIAAWDAAIERIRNAQMGNDFDGSVYGPMEDEFFALYRAEHGKAHFRKKLHEYVLTHLED